MADNAISRTGARTGASSSSSSGDGVRATPGARHYSVDAPHKRAQAVFDDVEPVDENFVVPVIPKSDDALKRISLACAGNTLFDGISNEQMQALCLAMTQVPTKPGDLIIRQGERGDNYYVVDSGEYDVLLKQKGDEPVHRYIGSGSFGELALLYQVPRASTVRCTVGGQLWALDRKTFRHALMAHNKLDADQTARFLQAVNELSALTDDQRAKLASALEELAYENGESLWEVGDRADWLCLIREGTVISTSSYREPLTFQVGSFFGTQVEPAAAPQAMRARIHARLPMGKYVCVCHATHCAEQHTVRAHAAGTQRRPEH